MEDFSLDLSNILDADELAALEGNQEEKLQEETQPEQTELHNDIKDTEDLEISDLFGSESVGDDKNIENNKERKGDTINSKSDSTPPNNLYSSIAKAFKEDGIFSDLEEDDINSITSPDDFAELVEKQISAKLDEKQKRIDQALRDGVEPSQIQMYENSLANLDKITDNDITDESEDGVALRKLLIKTDFINRGISESRAEALVKRAFDNNTDIEDARDALKGNKEYYSSKYKELLDEANKIAKEETSKRKKDAETLKASILEGEKVFGDVSVDKKTRQRVYDVISKPLYKDESGNYITEIQKYESEHKMEFMKNLGYLYVITDGFKSLGNLKNNIKKKVTSEGIKELEHTLNTTVKNIDGSLKFVSGVGDNDSYMNSGWSIDTK